WTHQGRAREQRWDFAVTNKAVRDRKWLEMSYRQIRSCAQISLGDKQESFVICCPLLRQYASLSLMRAFADRLFLPPQRSQGQMAAHCVPSRKRGIEYAVHWS